MKDVIVVGLTVREALYVARYFIDTFPFLINRSIRLTDGCIVEMNNHYRLRFVCEDRYYEHELRGRRGVTAINARWLEKELDKYTGRIYGHYQG